MPNQCEKVGQQDCAQQRLGPAFVPTGNPEEIELCGWYHLPETGESWGNKREDDLEGGYDGNSSTEDM